MECIKGKEWNPFPWLENSVVRCGCPECEKEMNRIIPTIPDDVSRCHNVTCIKRRECLRFLNRDKGGEHTVHTDSLANNFEDCDYFIELKK